MNRTSTKISVDKYLPIKRIVILSLVVTMAYYFLFTLNHYFARPSFDNRETESTLDEDDAKAKTVEYNDARDRSNERRREYFASPEEARRNFYKKVLLNIPLTFIMVFAVILFCKFICTFVITIVNQCLKRQIIADSLQKSCNDMASSYYDLFSIF